MSDDRQLKFPSSGDPIRCYTFDNVSGTTVYDEMGNGDATIGDLSKNTVVSGGRIGNCLSHTGGNGNYYDALGISDISTWRSFSCWSKFPVAGTKIYDLAYNASGPIMSRFADNTIRVQNGSTALATIADTSWHHFVMAWSSDTAYTLYIDNVVVATGTNSRGTLACIGGRVNVVNYVTPNLDIVHIYDYELSAADVSALYYLGGLAANLPALEMAFTGTVMADGWINTVLPSLIVDVQASYNSSSSVGISLPSISMESDCGVNAILGIDLPSFEFYATRGSQVGLFLPALDVDISSSTISSRANVGLELPAISASILASNPILSNISTQIPIIQFSAIGQSKDITWINADLPPLSFSSNATVKYSGGDVLDIDLPMFIFSSVASKPLTYQALSFNRNIVP